MRSIRIQGLDARHGLGAFAVPGQPLRAADLALDLLALERIDDIASEHRRLCRLEFHSDMKPVENATSRLRAAPVVPACVTPELGYLQVKS